MTTGIVCFPALASLHGVSYVRFPTFVPCAFGKRLFPFPSYVPFTSPGSPKNLEQVPRIGHLVEASPRAQQAAEAKAKSAKQAEEAKAKADGELSRDNERN